MMLNIFFYAYWLISPLNQCFTSYRFSSMVSHKISLVGCKPHLKEKGKRNRTNFHRMHQRDLYMVRLSIVL